MITLPRVAPGSGVIAAAGQVWATMRAEIAMQWRRWGLWVAFACVTALLLLLTIQAAIYLLHPPPTSLYVREHFTPEDFNHLLIYGGTYGVMFYGLLAALLVVDRLARDQRLGMAEVQRATPQGTARYALGKFLGNYVAVLAPILLSYLLCALITIPLGWPVTLVPQFLLAFLLIFVPSSLAAVGVTFLLASLLPVRVVQIGFSLLWFECNIGPGWHGLVYTIFNPNGLYVYPVFFPTPPMLYTEPNFHTSLSLALLNITVLVLTAILALMLTYGSLAFQQRRAEGA